MANKSLFLGAAAAAMLALLVLFTFAGCSNPTSDTEYVDRVVSTEFVYPVGTVFTDDFDELEGLLNPTAEETNGVTYIAFRANPPAFTDTLTIPAGKVVYVEDTAGNLLTLDQDIVVETGGTLVLVSEVATSTGAIPGKLWVKGLVEVYDTLTVTTNTLDVADYYEANGVFSAVYTVIGQRVAVKAGGTLDLPANAIRLANDTSHDEFTPAEAWAAAGQGNLLITGALDNTAFSVEYLLAGVGPSASRWYTVETPGGAPLPSYIPEGAFITADGPIADTPDHNLLVNGSLIANDPTATFKDIVNLTVNGILQADNATFESVENLIVAAVNTENTALSALPGTWPEHGGGWLGADAATLAAAKNINIGDNGTFVSDSTFIELPEEARIVLGKSASFTASGATTNTFGNLEQLYIGPASSVALNSTVVTLASLKKLRIHDSASLSAPNSLIVNAKLDEPAILGKHAAIAVTYAADAEVDLVLAGDTTIPAGTYTVTEKSTLTVNPGVTLTVAGTLDLSALKLPTTAAPAIPVQISGTIEVVSGGAIIGPDLAAADDKASMYTVYDFSGGKILLDYGAAYNMEVAAAADNLVGATGGTADAYEFAGADDGAQIEIAASGITIRDTTPAATPVGIALGASTDIIKEHALTLDEGVTLTIGSGFALGLTGDTAGGAKLLGAGKVVIVATLSEITGGSYGWQAYGGPGSISIENDTSVPTITASAAATTLRALGSGATITQLAIASNELVIGPSTVIELGGTSTKQAGVIILTGDGSDPGAISLDATAKITTGNTPDGTTAFLGNAGATDLTNAPPFIGIANVLGDGTATTGTQVTTTVTADGTNIGAGHLVALSGGTSATVEGGNAGGNDGFISSETPTKATP